MRQYLSGQRLTNAYGAVNLNGTDEESVMKRSLWGVSLMAALFSMITVAAPRHAAAAELEGVRFAERRQVGDASLELNCVGLLRYKYVIKAYVAALYLGSGVAPSDVLGDVPKRLEISYFWNLDGGDIARAGDEILAQNLDAETRVKLRPRLDRINALYENVKPGDRYALTYIPGVGTELSLNEQRKGVIPGADFANAYFRIWLGEQPIDTEFRDRLLACDKAGGAVGSTSGKLAAPKENG